MKGPVCYLTHSKRSVSASSEEGHETLQGSYPARQWGAEGWVESSMTPALVVEEMVGTGSVWGKKNFGEMSRSLCEAEGAFVCCFAQEKDE